MKRWRSDLYRHSATHSLTGAVRIFFRQPGFRFMALKRMCEAYGVAHPLGFIARFWFARLQVKFGLQIPHTAKIGSGFYIGHFGNIVINQGARVGNNCNVAQGVTIGSVRRGKKMGCPEIGDRVWIGANAVVVGNIRIGNDVLIAPLSYVNFDVPEKAVVMGNPAQIINYNGSGGYVNNIPE